MSYLKGLFHGLGSLLTGLKVTGREFFTPKVTEQYPENRATLQMHERFCGELTMPHDAIRFSTAFEHAVFTREKLVKQLNRR